MPTYDKTVTVSWDMFHRDARTLASQLADERPFAAIVAVARGGLVPAAIVARELGIRLVETVCITSYEHMNSRRREAPQECIARGDSAWR